MKKLENWPKISYDDHKGLETLADFLTQCLVASDSIHDLKRLDDMKQMNCIAQKLPNHILHAWQKTCIKTKQSKKRYPKFQEFCDFIELQAQLANDPIIHSTRQERPQQKEQHSKSLS